MPYSEHSVEWREGGTQVRQTREVFTTRDGRILGTETVRRTRRNGYMGTTWEETSPLTKQFGHPDEASDWMDEMFRAHHVGLAQGTRHSDLLYPVAS